MLIPIFLLSRYASSVAATAFIKGSNFYDVITDNIYSFQTFFFSLDSSNKLDRVSDITV